VTRYLLDADAVIDLLKGASPSVGIINDLYRRGDSLCTCDVVITEIFSGLYAEDRELGRKLTMSMQFLLTSERASRQAGVWRYDFRRRGIQLATTDCLIAAVALDRQATLVTGNVRDYPMPEISIVPLPRPR
jgi:predicted nucleic acid-binding protein